MALHYEQMAWFNYRLQMIPYVDELSAGDRAFFDVGILMYRNSPLLKLWYESTKSILSPDPVRYIDNLLAQPG